MNIIRGFEANLAASHALFPEVVPDFAHTLSLPLSVLVFGSVSVSVHVLNLFN